MKIKNFNFLFLKTLIIRLFSLNISILLGSIIIYSLNFIILENYDNYFLCNTIENINFTFFNSEFSLKYPISCDLYEYIEGIGRFNSIIEYDHSYQTRPVYILIINIISKFVQLFFTSESILIYLISIFIFHANILALSSYFFLKILKLDYSLKIHNIINIFLLVSPIYKWGIFDPAHQTLVFLAFSISLYLLTYIIKNTNVTIYIFFILGILYLANKVFILTFAIFILKINLPIKNFAEIKKRIFSFKNYLYLIVFAIPYVIYELYIQINGYESYNASIEYWGHFVWIIYFVLGLNNHEGVWYCTSIPENFYCYIADTSSVIRYYSIPIFFVAIYFIIRKINEKNLFLNLLAVFGVFYLFWSFIGWYPPLRFNLYSISPLVTFLFLYIFFNERIFLNRIIVISLYCLYFISLKHWNYPNVLDINSFYLILLAFNIAFLIKLYKDYSKTNE
jgi:hypothetical protein